MAASKKKGKTEMDYRKEAVKKFGLPLVKLCEEIVAHVKEPGEYQPIKLKWIAKEIQKYASRPVRVHNLGQLQEARGNVELTPSLRSLRSCPCLSVGIFDDNKYPDPKCKRCRGTGSYIPVSKSDMRSYPSDSAVIVARELIKWAKGGR